MSADVHQSVDLQGTPTDVPGHAKCAQTTRSTTGPLTVAVGGKCDTLSQEMRTFGPETKLSLFLAAQVSQKESGVLIRIEWEKTRVGKTDLGDL